MSERTSPTPFAIRAVSAGMSARAGLRAYRAGGGAIADSRWYRLVGEVRRNLSGRLDEATRPLGRRPTGDEVRQFPHAVQSGYIQQVEIYVYKRDTGQVVAQPFSVRGDSLVTRQAAVDHAVGVWTAGAANKTLDVDESILGAAYVGTYILDPEG